MKKLTTLLLVTLLFGCNDEYNQEKTIELLASYLDNIEAKVGCDVYGDFNDGYVTGKICASLVKNDSNKIAELTYDIENPLITAQFNTIDNSQTLIEAHINSTLTGTKYNPMIYSVNFNKMPLNISEPINYSVDSFATNLLECSLLNNEGNTVQINTPVNAQGEFQAADSAGTHTISCIGSQTYSQANYFRESDFSLEIENTTRAPYVKFRIIEGINIEGAQDGPLVMSAEIIGQNGNSIEVASSVEVSNNESTYYELEQSDNGLFSINLKDITGYYFFTSIKISDSTGSSTILYMDF